MKKSTSMRNEVTIGLDLGDQWSDWAAVAADGTFVMEARVRTTERYLRETFGALWPAVIALEVGTHSAWVSRCCGAADTRWWWRTLGGWR